MRKWTMMLLFLCFLWVTFLYASESAISTHLRKHFHSQEFQKKIEYYSRTFKSGGRKPRVLSNGVSVPGDFPVIHTVQHGETAPGRLFFSTTFFDSRSGTGNYIIICENDGTPYFYRRYDRSPNSNKGTADFRVQDNGLLSFHQYLEAESGIFYVMDHHFVHIDTFICNDPYWTDNHEFLMLPNGHALLIAEHRINDTDLSEVVPGGLSKAWVIHNYIQEMDSDGHVYWDWKSNDRLDFEDAVEANLYGGQTLYSAIDYVHINSVARDYDGHYIISLRYYNQVAKIDSGSGDFIWRLGGTKNQFTYINEEIQISSQHHVKPVPGKHNHYTIYDNGNSHSPPFSRAVEYKIDPVAMTAEKVWDYQYDQVNFSNMMGSVQRLSNGNTYIDWSAWPPTRACEVDSNNDLLFEIEVDGTSGYRSYRFEWEGKSLKPDLIAEGVQNGVNLIMNQFNDPDVDYFRIYHGTEPHPATPVDTSRSTLKYLTGLQNKATNYFRVTSVDILGNESDFSNETSVFIKIIEPGENQLLNHDFSLGDEFWIFGTYSSQGIDASGEIVDGAFCLDIRSMNGFNGAYVFQYPVELLEDQTYRFEFDAWADQQLNIQPMVTNISASTDYSRIGSVPVGTSSDHYAYEFTKRSSSTSEAIAGFLIEDNTGTLYVDNVSLKQVVTLKADGDGHQPALFHLGPNYPNPFNGITVLPFTILKTSEIILTLYDIQGKQISTIRKGDYQPGEHRLLFKDESLSSGVYFYQIEARSSHDKRGFQQVRKMIYLK